ncbi:cocE [Symbiodinium necroappetens]|uniref:CocE protein n=1 Tax=Symbiodinium necroappetens TaxID=1628268 RepID=A0A812YDC7_9DINO|nr:cocE [Symbiodinium necroappetens]
MTGCFPCAAVNELLKTIRAAWPMLSRAIRSGQVLSPQCQLETAGPDVQCDYDVAVPMKEGYSLTANVFRSRARMQASSPDPVIMCAHIYDNHITPALKRTPLGGPPQQYRLIPQGVPYPTFSELTSWESPDPNFWVSAGYTLVNLNLPGYANSGGAARIISTKQGRDYREAIEWVGQQDWCTGSVGLLGVSYLAISQYFAAVEGSAKEGSALKCMVPWEGLTDMYRDVACPGGVNGTGFLNFWWNTEVKEALNQSVAEFIANEGGIPPELISKHPLMDQYWADKAVELERIDIPMLVCGSFSDHELHTRGSHRAFSRVSSEKKWLYTHRGGKWSEFYSPSVQELVRDFMDHFLKGQSNRFESLPPVRLEIRSSREEVRDVRWEHEWPLARTDYKLLHLSEQGLAPEAPAESEHCYDGQHGRAEFKYTFTQDTEVSGFMNLRLWVEARPSSTHPACPDDIILCVVVDKLDSDGQQVRFNGTVGIQDDVVSRGYLRVSRREIDASISTDWWKEPKGSVVQPLESGQVVPIEITLCPTATFFCAGEGMRLVVSSFETCPSPIFTKDLTSNNGLHVLHMGGRFDSTLSVPVIPIKEA